MISRDEPSNPQLEWNLRRKNNDEDEDRRQPEPPQFPNRDRDRDDRDLDRAELPGTDGTDMP